MDELSSTKRRRSVLYFSTWTLLFLVACFAGGFAGFRIGHEKGLQIGLHKYDASTIIARVYPVADLVRTGSSKQTDLSAICDLIESTISPQLWYNGAYINRNENATLVISQLPEHHLQIEQLLEQLRTVGRHARKQAGNYGAF